MNILPRFVIVSAYRNDRSASLNKYYTRLLGGQLAARGFKISPVIGQWHGLKEISWLVLDAGADDVSQLAVRYGQIVVLEVDTARLATLVSAGGVRFPFGKFQAITPAEAAKRETWTKDKHGQYYACLPTAAGAGGLALRALDLPRLAA